MCCLFFCVIEGLEPVRVKALRKQFSELFLALSGEHLCEPSACEAGGRSLPARQAASLWKSAPKHRFSNKILTRYAQNKATQRFLKPEKVQKTIQSNPLKSSQKKSALINKTGCQTKKRCTAKCNVLTFFINN